ncbi:MAG: DUF4129 domain-containing transglutaminase family protein, partial [Dehalococcoidia bacterium]
KAAAIERYLRKIMFYSTDIEPPPEDADGVDYFLFTSMRGYSSYFASAMTVMLRTIGIPARLAVGYSTGDWDEEQNAYVVRSSNAHAWPEAYFPGYGWISFEPVPIQDLFVRGGVIDDDFRIRPRGGPGGQAGGPLPPRASAGGSVPGSSVTSQDRGWLIWVPPVVVGSLLVFAILARYWYNRGLGRLDRPWQVYGKMGRLATLGRLGPKTSYTPREYGEALATEMDVVEGHVEGIAEAYGQSRYGPQGLPREGEELLAKSWRSLRRTLVFWALKRRILFWRSG